MTGPDPAGLDETTVERAAQVLHSYMAQSVADAGGPVPPPWALLSANVQEQTRTMVRVVLLAAGAAAHLP